MVARDEVGFEELISNSSVPNISYLGGFPEHELELAQSPPPDPGISRLELGLALVEEVDQVGGDGQQDGLGGSLVGVLPVPLVQQVDVVAHTDQRLPQHLQLRRIDLGGDRPVAVPGILILLQGCLLVFLCVNITVITYF